MPNSVCRSEELYLWWIRARIASPSPSRSAADLPIQALILNKLEAVHLAFDRNIALNDISSLVYVELRSGRL